jgi:hypothetical protein
MSTPPALLKRDRQMYARECDKKVNVLRAKPRPNGGGGSSAKTGYVMRDVAARMIPARSVYNATEGRQIFVGDARFCLCDPAIEPSLMDVKQGDLLEAGGERWKLIGTDAGQADAVCLVCDVKREGA